MSRELARLVQLEVPHIGLASWRSMRRKSMHPSAFRRGNTIRGRDVSQQLIVKTKRMLVHRHITPSHEQARMCAVTLSLKDRQEEKLYLVL